MVARLYYNFMSKFAKILVTLGVILIFYLLFALIIVAGGNSDNSTPGILGLILLSTLLSAICAIWRNDKKNGKEEDNSMLQK